MSFLITSVLNCASDRLAISSLLSCIFSGALICSFIGAIFLSWCTCYVKGRSLRYSLGPGNTGRCSVTMYQGGGAEREQWRPLCSLVFSHSPTTHNQIGPLWCWFLSGWACAHPRPLWVSPTNSPVRLGVSPAATSTPTGVFTQRFEALFPRAGALGCVVCHLVHQLLPRLPAAALPTPLHNPPPCWVRQPPFCHESSLPGTCLRPSYLSG